MLISVIVPIYNTEQYLPLCIESILRQAYKDIELILVDDGSTDGSLKICLDYAKKDLRISIIQKEHSGLVMARKLGVERSKGLYCMFVDSDDWIADDLLETIIPLTDGGNIDIVNYNIRSIEKGKTIEWKYIIPEGIYEHQQLGKVYKKMMFDFEEGYPGIIQSLCSKLIKRNILWSSLKGMDDRITIGEDAAVVYSTMLKAKRIAITNSCLYNYRIHATSMFHTKNVDIFDKINVFYQYMQSIFSGLDDNYELTKQLQAYLIHFIVKGVSDIFSLNIYNLYRIPFCLSDIGKDVVLYGAGKVGQSYFRQLEQCKNIRVVAWVDKKLGNKELYNYKIKLPEMIYNTNFDTLLIAVKDPEIAEEIRNELCNNIPLRKILWKSPKVNWWEKEIVF